MDLHSHNVSIPYCQLFEVYHCAFISCFEWAFKIDTHCCSTQKAFQKGIGNVLVWEDIIALAPSFPFFYLVKGLLF